MELSLLLPLEVSACSLGLGGRGGVLESIYIYRLREVESWKHKWEEEQEGRAHHMGNLLEGRGGGRCSSGRLLPPAQEGAHS